MIPTRKLAAMFFCVFVLGAVAGALAFYILGESHFSDFLNKTNDPAKIADRVDKRLASQYALSADEQARIAPVAKDMAQNLYQLRLKFGTDVLAALDDAHQKIGAQMTPEHAAAYAKDNVDRRKRTAAMLLPAVVPASQP